VNPPLIVSLLPGLELAPASGAVVGDDLLEHGGQGSGFDCVGNRVIVGRWL
jgi:hypothetical protein